MNELYELTIESADLELAVTEGFADKAKSTASKIIEKLKTFIKKFIVFIKDKCVKFIKYVLHLATKLKNLTEMDDREMIDVPNCIIVDDSAKTLMSIEKKYYVLSHNWRRVLMLMKSTLIFQKNVVQ